MDILVGIFAVFLCIILFRRTNIMLDRMARIENELKEKRTLPSHPENSVSDHQTDDSHLSA